MLDGTAQVRAGEELDGAALEAYLHARIPDLSGSLVIEQFPKGHSNLTYLLRVGSRELVLRRPPFGSKVKSAHDMGREFRVLSGLQGVYPAAPRPLLFCDEPSVLGADFYVMERIAGVIFRGDRPDDVDLPPAMVRAICFGLIDNLADLHLLDWEKAGLGALRKDGSYAERQVSGWIKRYEGSKTDDIPEMTRTGAWLAGRIPADSGAALVHNDYKFDNVVLDPDDLTRIRGVLDWEMATIGDPLMDLGTALGYWNEKGDAAFGTTQCFLTTMEGAPTRRELAARYAERTGADISNMNYYYVFALYKLAVILQQIYYRYHQGLTRDERFAPLIHLVRVLAENAERAIETGRY